jgi:ubiquinone/menaquinone biosynthesis C-methylase UbiE
MIDASFDTMKEDLLSVIDFAVQKFSLAGVGIIGNSLGIRVAINAASHDPRIRFFCGLVGIVDLRSSLKAVYHQDVIGDILENRYQGKTLDDILGFEVSVNFALSAIQQGYHDLESTKQDFARITIPVVMMNAENDAWINSRDVQSLMESAPMKDKNFIFLPGAMHQLNENPQAARYALAQTVINAKKFLMNSDIKPEEILEPAPEELLTQWLIEEGRLRNLIQKGLEGEKEFWEKYLNKFVLIQKSPDYRNFLTNVSRSLNIQPGENVLDAGCGNGHFAAWLFDTMLDKIFRENIRLENFSPVRYVGLDFAERNLNEAMLKTLNLSRRVYRELSLKDKYPIVKFRFVQADIEVPLPFQDNYFDKICCNLVLSYVQDPLFSLKELLRVLKEGGKIIVSSMKPDADMSQVYRNFVDRTENPEELEEARKLLSAAGKIKQKENAGLYSFFSETELRDLFHQAGAKNIYVCREFANQSNVIVGEK